MIKNNTTIDITENAATQIEEIINRERSAANGIRVGVRGGGCSGLTYDIDLEKEEQEGDRIFDGPRGIKLYINKKSYLFLVGTVLDWSGGLNGKGFEFSNPNATATCGCGESFAA
jgi:iron-sulfur cluster assembly protein